MSLVYQKWQITWENRGAALGQTQPSELPCLALANACPLQPRVQPPSWARRCGCSARLAAVVPVMAEARAEAHLLEKVIKAQ